MSEKYIDNIATCDNVITMDKIESTLELLEKVHHIELKDIRQFICENEAGVIDGLNSLIPSSTIESKFNAMEGTFSNLPNYQDYSHYMLEFAVLVS